MKEGWEYRKLGEVGTFVRCNGILKSDFVDNGYPCIHYGQIHTKFGIATYEHLSEIQKALYDKSRIANPGDIVLAITSENVEGSCKCTAWLGDYDVAVGAHAAIFKHKQNSKYLSYCFRSKSFGIQKAKYARGFKVTEIKPSEVALIEIPVPPIEEQRRIVSELDLLSGIIEKQKAQLKELDTLAQSIFYDMFGDPVENEKGWKMRRIETVCTNIVDCPHSTPKKSDHITQYPCIRTSELKEGAISWISMQYLEKVEYLKRISRLMPLAGDIVFGREGSIGDAVILPEGHFFSLGQRTMLLRADPKQISNVFLHRTLISRWIKMQIDAVNVSSTVAHVNIKDFKSFIIPLPPLALQQQFARKIELIESQKQSISKSIAETQKLFDYTMDKYFG